MKLWFYIHGNLIWNYVHVFCFRIQGTRVFNGYFFMNTQESLYLCSLYKEENEFLKVEYNTSCPRCLMS